MSTFVFWLHDYITKIDFEHSSVNSGISSEPPVMCKVYCTKTKDLLLIQQDFSIRSILDDQGYINGKPL